MDGWMDRRTFLWRCETASNNDQEWLASDWGGLSGILEVGFTDGWTDGWTDPLKEKRGRI